MAKRIYGLPFQGPIPKPDPVEEIYEWQASGPEATPFMSASISEPFGTFRGVDLEPEPEPEDLPREKPRETLHPVSDREAFLKAVREINDWDRMLTTTPDCSPGVIPFHWFGGHNLNDRVVEEREHRKEVERMRREIREHERRQAEPWAEGEWTGEAHWTLAPIDPEAVRRDQEREARRRRRDAERREREEVRIAWADESPGWWPEDTTSAWCNQDYHAGWTDGPGDEWCEGPAWDWGEDEATCWCIGDGGGWITEGEIGWSGDEMDGWAEDEGYWYRPWREAEWRWCEED